MIINLKESLKEIDKDTCCEYNLLTMYEACNLSNKEKYKEFQDKDGNLSFSKFKEFYEESGYVCQ